VRERVALFLIFIFYVSEKRDKSREEELERVLESGSGFSCFFFSFIFFSCFAEREKKGAGLCFYFSDKEGAIRVGKQRGFFVFPFLFLL
jgi:hypothetical protein